MAKRAGLPRDAAREAVRTDGGHAECTGSFHDERPGANRVPLLAPDRLGFPGQDRFVYTQIVSGLEGSVGGHLVASNQEHQIAHHQLLDRDRADRAIAFDHGLRRDQ